MRTEDDRPLMRLQFDTHHCTLSEADKDQMISDLDSVAKQVANFPISDLHVLIEFNNRSNDYSVKTSLILPGSTLVANDHDPLIHTAWQRCLTVLQENIRAYKDKLGNVPEMQRQVKGTQFDVVAAQLPDFEALDAAVAAGDYQAFRTAALPYEETVRKKAGRWVERYPEIAAKMNHTFDIGDVTEAVFLEAFEAYESRPREVRFGDWLEGLIDPVIKSIHAGGEYLDNVRLARTAREAMTTV